MDLITPNLNCTKFLKNSFVENVLQKNNFDISNYAETLDDNDTFTKTEQYNEILFYLQSVAGNTSNNSVIQLLDNLIFSHFDMICDVTNLININVLTIDVIKWLINNKPIQYVRIDDCPVDKSNLKLLDISYFNGTFSLEKITTNNIDIFTVLSFLNFAAKLSNSICELEKIVSNKKKIYTNDTIFVFLKLLIKTYDLSDYNPANSPIDYAKNIYAQLYNTTNINWIDDCVLKCKSIPRFLNDILHFYSLIIHNQIQFDENITKLFLTMLNDLYLDRSDVNFQKKINLDTPSITYGDLYTKTLNTSYEINLISFLEEDGEVNHTIRNDMDKLKDILHISYIFNKIGHSVYYLCSDVETDRQNRIYWNNKPVCFSEDIYNKFINDIAKNYMTHNVIQVFLKVDFDCA